jgi:hypothetical protein
MKGVTTGMLRTPYQDWLFEMNDRDDRRLADDKIAVAMNEEHPMGKPIPPEQVRSIRARYNAGSQGHGPPPTGRPSYPYDENGQYRYPSTGWRR